MDFQQAEQYLMELAHAERQRLLRIEEESGGLERKHDIDDYRAIFNSTDDRLACIATTTYQLRQHKDYFQTAFEAIRKYTMTVDYIRVSDNRERVDMEVVPETPINVGGETRLHLGVRFSNSIDKSISACVLPYGMSGESFGIYGRKLLGGKTMRHVGENITADRIKDVTEQSIKKAENKLKELISAARNQSVSNVMDELAETGLGKKYQEDVAQQFPPGLVAHDSGNVKNSVNVWQLFKATTEYIDQQKEIQEGTRDDLHRKANRLLLSA